jgi:hypothetical protein
MRTIRLQDGKYEFDIDELDTIRAARCHGVSWMAGLELRFTNCFVAALLRIAELEDEVERAYWIQLIHFILMSKRLVGDE